jgi:uncharacterized protein YktB (UPF0637 family)
LRELASVRRAIPASFVWSRDHTAPQGTPHGSLSDDELAEWLRRLQTVKAAEITCGIHLQRGDPIVASGTAFLRKAEETFRTLLPLYRMAASSV